MQDKEKGAQIIEKLTKEGEGRFQISQRVQILLVRGVVNILGGVLLLGVASSGAGSVVGGSKPLAYYKKKKKKKKGFMDRGVGSSTQHGR